MINARVSNPFATKFVNAGRLDFVGLDDDTLDRLANELICQNGNGQITGGHGVGKTTLTYELEKRAKRVAEFCGTDVSFKFIRKIIGPRGAIRSVERRERRSI